MSRVRSRVDGRRTVRNYMVLWRTIYERSFESIEIKLDELFTIKERWFKKFWCI